MRKALSMTVATLCCISTPFAQASIGSSQLRQQRENDAMHAEVQKLQGSWNVTSVSSLSLKVPAWWNQVHSNKSSALLPLNGGSPHLLTLTPKKDPLKLDEWKKSILSIAVINNVAPLDRASWGKLYGDIKFWGDMQTDQWVLLGTRFNYAESETMLLGAPAMQFTLEADANEAQLYAARRIVGELNGKRIIISMITPVEVREKANELFDQLLASITIGGSASSAASQATPAVRTKSSSSRSSTVAPVLRGSRIQARPLKIRKQERSERKSGSSARSS